MKTLKTCFLVVLLSGFLVGCSSDSNDVDENAVDENAVGSDTDDNDAGGNDTNGDDTNGNDANADSETENEAQDADTETGNESEGNETENVTPARFIGSWSSACIVDTDEDGGFDAIIYTFEFTESTFRHSISAFVDENCNSDVVGLDFSSIVRLQGTHRSVGQVTTSAGLLAEELTLNIESGSSQFAGGEIVPTDLNELDQSTIGLLVFVDDSDVLFVDDIALTSLDNNTMNLDVPFQRRTDNTTSIESITELTPLAEEIVDLPDRYEITLRSTSGSSQTANITPRRTQQFSVNPGQSCGWTATDRNTGQLIGAGSVEGSNDMLATVVGVPVVTGIGTRLAIDCSPLHPIAQSLQGNWTTGCFLFDREGNAQSSRTDFTVAGSSSVFESRRYADTNCTVPAVSSTTGEELMTRFEDTIVFPRETVATSLGEAPFLNFFNGSSTRFTIFTITPDERLFFGNGISTSEENRPLTLDVFFYHHRR